MALLISLYVTLIRHCNDKTYKHVCTDDLSKDKVATQSTTAASSYFKTYVAGNAVDRNVTTCMRTEPIGGASFYNSVWWRVDLSGVYSIHSVDILFKNYDGFGIT